MDMSQAMPLNLAVLQQRLDPAIESIIASATHVAMYKFDDETKGWVKCGIEGAIFIVNRRVLLASTSVFLLPDSMCSPKSLCYV